VASGLNNSIRFRVRGSGPEREIVPDNQLAYALMGTTAGPKLLRQLEVAARSTDWAADKTRLKGYILPRDSQAVAAAEVLSELEPGGMPLAQPRISIPRSNADLSKGLAQIYAGSLDESTHAGAWNARGWITFMPDEARALLVSVGAYAPGPGEEGYRAAHLAVPMAAAPTHESQHSITPRADRYENERWMEEGIANVFSETPVLARQIRHDSGMSEQSWAGHLAHKPVIDLGWGPWTRPEIPQAEQAEQDHTTQQRYVDSVPILRGLLRMAGAPMNTRAGIDKARELLQGSNLDRVPGNLARSIVERNGLPESAYEPLRQRIIHAIEDPHSLQKIARDFHVKGP
jgi:hypothetical protein